MDIVIQHRQADKAQTLGYDISSKQQARGKTLQGKEIKKDRYLPRPALSSYRLVDLYYHHWAHHWAPQMDHWWRTPVIHQARTQEDNTFFFLSSTTENIRQLRLYSRGIRNQLI